MNCPNCHTPHTGLYTTPDLGPDMGGVTHCGCFYEGDAAGKGAHVDTVPAWRQRFMVGDGVEMVACDGGEAVCS